MIKKILFVIFIFCGVTGFCQDKEQLLKASVKQNSSFNKKSAESGYALIGLKSRFGTKLENQVEVKEEITRLEYVGDTMMVEVATVANCCASFTGELEMKENNTFNLLFEKNDQDCFCLTGFYLTYKITGVAQQNPSFQLNGKSLKQRTTDPNQEREETELWPNGNVKSIKLYLGEELKTEHQYDEQGKKVKTIRNMNGKMIEKVY